MLFRENVADEISKNKGRLDCQCPEVMFTKQEMRIVTAYAMKGPLKTSDKEEICRLRSLLKRPNTPRGGW